MRLPTTFTRTLLLAATRPRLAPPAMQNTQRLPNPPPDGVEPQKKRHALLTFGFTGTGFWGLQSQTADGDPERPTVSDLVRAALRDAGFIQPSNWAPLVRTKWQLASRTDKGVHAACAAASLMLETTAADVDLLPAAGEEEHAEQNTH